MDVDLKGDKAFKEESLDADDLDSNKLDSIIDTSLTVKSEVGDDNNDDGDDNDGDEVNDDDDDNDDDNDDDDEEEEKKDSEKDVEEDDGDLIPNEGDIKVEDLEEQNDLDNNKEVGIRGQKVLGHQTTYISSIILYFPLPLTENCDNELLVLNEM